MRINTIKLDVLSLFQQYMSETSEGKKHKTFYPFDTYPYVAIIDPKTGERMKLLSSCRTAMTFLEEGSHRNFWFVYFY